MIQDSLKTLLKEEFKLQIIGDKPLGEGGVAYVYLIEDLKDNKQYAFKMLKQDHVSNTNIRKRFIDEAKKLCRIDHENVVRVYSTIDQGDIVAYTMERIDGVTLAEIKNQNDESIKDNLFQILEGLKEVHSRGIVHRDLTPANIMVTNAGIVKILDFGISKDLDRTIHDKTVAGTTFTMGTPRYMSPEQYNDTSSTTITSDIYSLGVILWEMVKGEVVYENIKTMHSLGDKILKEKLPLTNTSWDQIIQKATSKNSNTRFNNCDEFIQAIKNKKNGPIIPWKKIATIASITAAVVLILVFFIKNSGEKEVEVEKIEKDVKVNPISKIETDEKSEPNKETTIETVENTEAQEEVKPEKTPISSTTLKQPEPDVKYKLQLESSTNSVSFNYDEKYAYTFEVFRSGKKTTKNGNTITDRSGNMCEFTFSETNGELKLKPTSEFQGDKNTITIEVVIKAKGSNSQKSKINVNLDCNQ